MLKRLFLQGVACIPISFLTTQMANGARVIQSGFQDSTYNRIKQPDMTVKETMNRDIHIPVHVMLIQRFTKKHHVDSNTSADESNTHRLLDQTGIIRHRFNIRQ